MNNVIKAFVLSCAALLAGCNDDDKNYVERTQYNQDVLYLGDRNCSIAYNDTLTEDFEYENDAQSRLGLYRVCGHSMTVADALYFQHSEQFRIAFIAIGYDDIPYQDVDQFKADYSTLFDKIKADRKICVLPQYEVGGFSGYEYRKAVDEVCDETIDPYDYRVVFEAQNDYMTIEDHDFWYEALKELVYE